MPENKESNQYFQELATQGHSNIHGDAFKGIASGIKMARKAVEGTIGGKGTNAIIKQEFYPYYIQTKDAFSIIQSIKAKHPVEKLAIDMMKDATDSMNKRSKDGRTGMCILTDEILDAAAKSGKNYTVFEEEINALFPTIEKLIDDQTRPIDVDQVEAVATTASDSPRLGKLISEIYKKQGKDCIINHIEASGTFEDQVTYTEGVKFMDTGFLSPSLVHDEEAKKANRSEKRAVYFNPTVLVTKRKITTEADILPLIQSLIAQSKKDLIIFADDMDSNVATTLINTHKAGVMNICIIKAPVLWKEYVFEDFAKVTGATIVEDGTGVTFKNLEFGHLGTCGKIVIDKEETIITGIADITEHLHDLRNSDNRDAQLRLWWLNNKTATIKLGATNEGELSLLRLKCEDAVHSAQLALQGGVVAGGGIALQNAATSLKDPYMCHIFRAPFLQILKNAGLGEEMQTQFSSGMGINVKTGEIVNMFEAGIVDSALVVKNQVRNAIGIASRALTTNVFIDIPEKTMQEMQLEILGKQRSPFQ